MSILAVALAAATAGVACLLIALTGWALERCTLPQTCTYAPVTLPQECAAEVTVSEQSFPKLYIRPYFDAALKPFPVGGEITARVFRAVMAANAVYQAAYEKDMAILGDTWSVV